MLRRITPALLSLLLIFSSITPPSPPPQNPTPNENKREMVIPEGQLKVYLRDRLPAAKQIKTVVTKDKEDRRGSNEQIS